MNATEFKHIRQRKMANSAIWWIKTALFGVLVGGVLYSCAANAYGRPRPIYRPHGRGEVVIVEGPHHHVNPASYILTGVMASIIIYHIAQTRCDNGIICTKF